MGAILFASCFSNEDVFDPAKQGDLKKAKYAEAFIKAFGQVHPEQDWGFGKAPVAATRVSSNPGAVDNPQNFPQYTKPAAITSEEIAKVKTVFADPEAKNKAVQAITLSDFWVQHVVAVRHSYETWENQGGQKQTVNDACTKMDMLSVRNAGGQTDVQRFNQSEGTLMHLVDAAGVEFGYRNTLDEKMHWGEYIILKIDGAYYLGFDFSSFKSDATLGSGYADGDKNVDADGIYDDWIIKITGMQSLEPEVCRILVEDLNAESSSDFDFNDVVFDAKLVDGGAEITLQAVGGIYPLYVGGKEVHDAFGVEVTEFVNTVDMTKQPVTFTITGNFASLNDIPVTVDFGNGEQGLTLIEANQGEVSGKLCVSTDVQWATERQALKELYPNFTQYVQTAGPAEWWK